MMLSAKLVSGLGLSNDPEQYVLTPRTAQKYKIVNKKYEDIFKQPPYGQPNDMFPPQVLQYRVLITFILSLLLFFFTFSFYLFVYFLIVI